MPRGIPTKQVELSQEVARLKEELKRAKAEQPPAPKLTRDQALQLIAEVASHGRYDCNGEREKAGALDTIQSILLVTDDSPLEAP